MSHPRVTNVRWPEARWDVYAGRGRCPRTGRPGRWGNPFKADDLGTGSPLLRYLDWLRDAEAGQAVARRARLELPGLVLGCWCAKKQGAWWCHGCVLAYLADGRELAWIRAAYLEGASWQLGLFG